MLLKRIPADADCRENSAYHRARNEIDDAGHTCRPAHPLQSMLGVKLLTAEAVEAFGPDMSLSKLNATPRLS